MTKQEAIDFIYSSYLKAEKYIPYEEKDAFRRSPDLLKAELNDEAFDRSTNILVTGSKGKGSTARFIAALLSSIDFFTDVDDPGALKKNSAIAFQGQQVSAVGLVTSPEVLDFTDRIQVVKSIIDSDGSLKFKFSNISVENFFREISEIAPKIKELDEALPKDKYVSPIGIVALLAQRYFSKINSGNNTVQLNAHSDERDRGSENEKKELHIKYKVFECGKGAKYDDTNRIKHEVSVVTPIFLEHKRELGDTIEEIASDKACIVTDDVKILVSGRQQESVASILEKRCSEKKAEFFILGKDFSVSNVGIINGKSVFDFEASAPFHLELHNLEIPLLGAFQAENAAVAIETALAASTMRNCGSGGQYTEISKAFKNNSFSGRDLYKIEDVANVDSDKLVKFINSIFSSVNYPGRLEILKNNPPVVLDNTINRESAKNIYPVLNELLCQEGTRFKSDLESKTNVKYTLILSIPNDKDFTGVAAYLQDIIDEIFLMPLKNPHYKIDAHAEKDILAKDFFDASVKIDIIDENEIPALLQKTVKPILICGVTAMVKEVHEILG